MNPLVTVITVTYNCERTLAATLDSVRAVKLPSVEYVVVDGASTDGTLDLLHANQDIIDVLLSEPDAGIYDAMNKAARLANGKYVIFLNGDDQFIPRGFTSALLQLSDAADSIVSCSCYVNSAAAPTEVLRASTVRLARINSIPHPSTFTPAEIQRELGFDCTFQIAADYDFFVRAIKAGVRIRTLDIAVAVHYRGGASGDAARSSHEVDIIQHRHFNRRARYLARLRGVLHRLGRLVRLGSTARPVAQVGPR